MMGKLLAIMLCTLLLCSCYSHPCCTSPTDRVAICKELRSKIIFNGNTSNIRTSDIENSEMAILQRQYERYQCDCI